MQFRIGLIIFVIFSGGLFSRDYRENIVKSYSIDKNIHFKLSNINGHIEVVTQKGNELIVDAVKIAEAESDLSDVEISFQKESERLEIETKRLRKHTSTRVNYVVTLPAGQEYVKLSSVNGYINLKGDFVGIKSESVNGPIELEGHFTEGTFKTLNGKISLYITKELSGDIAAKSVNGTIKIELKRDSSFRIKGSTLNGTFRSDFDLDVMKKFIGASIKGFVNKGKHTIHVKTANGNIVLLKI